MTRTSTRTRRTVVLGATAALVAAALLQTGPATGDPARAAARTTAPTHRPKTPTKHPTAVGTGGGVASVDADATRIGTQVLRHGGNAIDAAIATAAALGVTEPYSTGVGGGGYLLYYDARTHQTHVIDGRETAPAAMPHDAFINPKSGKPYAFTPERVTSGVAVGTPGSPATWTTALRRYGSWSLARTLRPAERLADRGFVVDPTFRQQTKQNRERFRTFTSTRRLYLPHGHLPRLHSQFRNPDLADTYRAFGRDPRLFYRGALPHQISHLVHHPPLTHATKLPVPRGYLRPGDFARYRTIIRKPTHVGYRGYQVLGVPPSSSGGVTVGETLNVMQTQRLSALPAVQALHYYLDAGSLAFADRAANLGDPRFVHTHQHALLSQRFADERACLIPTTRAMKTPVRPGNVHRYDGRCSGRAPSRGSVAEEHEGPETSNLTVVDRRGDVVEYTLTIEQTGGSGIVVPGRGFLLNNELTDFDAVYDKSDPNRIEPGKRPRSSISPTLVMKHGRPHLALGSPGGATIITTVLQILFDRLDRDMSLPQSIAAPRASPENTAKIVAEPPFIRRYGKQLRAYGYRFAPSGDSFTLLAQIGAATAIELHRHGRLVVAAEPVRRGGGSAQVVHPTHKPSR